MKSYKKLKAEQIIRVLLNHYLIDMLISKKYKRSKDEQGLKDNQMTFKQFQTYLVQFSAFLNQKPSKELLEQIFAGLDKNKVGKITLFEYREFIRKTLGVDNQKAQIPTRIPKDISKQQQQFITAIKNQITKQFNKIKHKNRDYLTKDQTIDFLQQKLKCKDYEFDIIFKNHGLDHNDDNRIHIDQFASAIFAYQMNQGINQFHVKHNKLDHQILTYEDTVSVFDISLNYWIENKIDFSTMVRALFDQIKDQTITYAKLRVWTDKLKQSLRKQCKI